MLDLGRVSTRTGDRSETVGDWAGVTGTPGTSSRRRKGTMGGEGAVSWEPLWGTEILDTELHPGGAGTGVRLS